MTAFPLHKSVPEPSEIKMGCQFLKITVLQIQDDTTLQKILSNAIYKYTVFSVESQTSQALSVPHNNP